jgi:hypothetical protein
MLERSLTEGYNYPTSKSPEVCKPDYEMMISRNRKNKERYSKFINAFYEFIGFEVITGGLAELLGELITNERKYDNIVQELIHQQENDK